MDTYPVTKEHLKKLRRPELIRLYNEYDGICYGPNACFGTTDMIALSLIKDEIFRREERSERP